MWIRKSEDQIARERPNLWLSFRGPLLWFLILLVLGTFITIEGPRGAVQRWPETWGAILANSIVLAGISSLIVYVLQLVLRRKIDPLEINGKFVICDNCHRVTRPGDKARCECGGRFDDFDNWIWTE
jgi:hypothetical protein